MNGCQSSPESNAAISVEMKDLSKASPPPSVSFVESPGGNGDMASSSSSMAVAGEVSSLLF